MEKINCSAAIDYKQKKVTIDGLNDKSIIIDYSGDKIITAELVTALVGLSKLKKQFVISIPVPEITDEKLNLVLFCLEGTVESFNEDLMNEILQNKRKKSKKGKPREAKMKR